MTDASTCAHHPCTCRVEQGQRYCGEHCKSAAADSSAAVALDMEACNCGHSDCLLGERGARVRGSASQTRS